MKRFFLIAFTLFFSTVSIQLSAQKASLTGDWKFHELHNPDPESEGGLSEQEVEMLSELFGATSFSFNEDGTYSVSMMGRNDSGEYALIKKGKQVEMTAENGDATRIDVIALEGDLFTFVFEGRAKGGIVMKRVGADAEGGASSEASETGSAAPAAEGEFVETRTEDIAQKWFLHERVVGEPVRDAVPEKDQDKAFKDMQKIMREMTFEMMSDGVFKSDGPSGEMVGTWKFGDTNDTVIIDGGVVTTWKVFRISDKELVLKLDYPNTSEYYFFESTKAE